MKAIIFFLSMFVLISPTFSQVWNSTGDNSTTGRLGIGISSPTYDLDISKTTPYLRIHSSEYTNSPVSIVKKGGIIFGQQNGDKTAAVLFAVPPGYHVPGILFATKEAWNIPGTTATSWYDRMFIHPNGNVGMGITNPSNTLHVDGTFRLNGNAGLPENSESSSSSNYANKYSFKLTSTNNGFYISLSNVFNERKVYFQAGHQDPSYAYGTGTLCLNPFGGNVGVGTTEPDAPLTVKGTIHTREVRVDMAGSVAPDYVFEKDYNLLPLSEVEAYINQNKHLPEVPSAKEMEEYGLNLKEMNLLLLKKVEELTLHLIEQNRINENQKKINENLLNEITELKNQ